MPNYRCEFKVTCDLVLGDENNSLSIDGYDGKTYEFSNASTEEDHVSNLIVAVIGEADSIDSAQEHLRSCLAVQLDMFTFATHSRCKIEEPIRIVEWEAGKEERHFKSFHTSDARFPPEPNLVQEFLTTSNILDNAGPPAFVRTALKYFRFGVLDTQPEDQFMRFWLALEIIAENIKENEKVPIICPECKTPITCNTCGTEPMRMPMAKQAIEQLAERIIGENWREVSAPLFIVRNGLIHGSSEESIEKKSKQPISVSVNDLARLVWNAIRINIKLEKEEASKLVIGHWGGDFVNKRVVASVNGLFKHTEDTPHPALDKIPNIKVSLITKFDDEKK